MSGRQTTRKADAFPRGSLADWIADEISAVEATTRGRYPRTSHLLVLALEALAAEVSNEPRDRSASEWTS